MGQRLNIEIVNNNGVLANAYYHWSGYTDSSAELLAQILTSDAFTKRDKSEDPVLTAIKLLELTNAGMTDEELLQVSENRDKFSQAVIFRPAKRCIDRNEGILSIMPESIENTEYWEEGRVTINLDTDKVDFNVIWEADRGDYSSEDDYQEAIKEAYNCPYDLHDMTVEEALKFCEIAMNEIHTFKNNDGKYYSAIY